MRLITAAMVAVTALPGTAVAAPVAASAASMITSGSWINPVGLQPWVTDYTVTTTRPYWSVILQRPGYVNASEPSQIPSYTLRALNGNQILGASNYTDFRPNFVAIDGNIRTAQSYTARIVKISDNNFSEQYGLTFVDGGSILQAGHSAIPDVANGEPNNVVIRDVYLPAGVTVDVTIAESNVTCPQAYGTLALQAYWLVSDPTRPGSAILPRSATLPSAAQLFQRGPDCAVEFSTSIGRPAWYGLLIFKGNHTPLQLDVTTAPISLSPKPVTPRP
jgi:hypothetical protein